MEVENDSGEIETESETKLRMKEIIIFERASKDDVYERRGGGGKYIVEFCFWNTGLN